MTDPYQSPAERALARDRVAGLPEEVRAAQRAQLRAMIAADLAAGAAPASPVRGRASARHWRRWSTALIAGGALALTGGVAVAFLPRSQPTQLDLVRCFSRAEPPFGESPRVPSAALSQHGTLLESAHEAIDLCASLWRDGWLPDPETKDQDDPPPGNQPVPELHACVLPDGVAGVFPGQESVCISLGLPASLA